MTEPDAICIITGLPASGKTSVAEGLARRSKKSAHIHGDQFRRFVVGGRVDMSPDLDPEAVSQLFLRYELAAHCARSYAQRGFSVFVQDVVIGTYLNDFLAMFHPMPVDLIVLNPSVATLVARDEGRRKTAYKHEGFPIGALWDALQTESPRVGLWVDTSQMTLAETVRYIDTHRHEGRLPVV